MDSSSEDEGVITHRRSTGRKIFDSDDDDEPQKNRAEPTEDFVLHLSDEDGEGVDDMASVQAKIEASLLSQNVNPVQSIDNISSDISSFATPQLQAASNADAQSSSSPMTESKEGNALHCNELVKGTIFHGKESVMKKLSALADSDSESDVDGDLQPLPLKGKKTKSSVKNTLSSESDSDSDSTSSVKKLSIMSVKDENSRSDSKDLKNKPKTERKSKTAAKNAMLEIKAESQRQLRQSSIGLPYHIPKQRTLSEFLNRRKTLSHLPVKGPAEQLEAVWREIENRVKQAEEFYQSESDSEDDPNDNCESTPAEEHSNDNCESTPAEESSEEKVTHVLNEEKPKDSSQNRLGDSGNSNNVSGEENCKMECVKGTEETISKSFNDPSHASQNSLEVDESASGIPHTESNNASHDSKTVQTESNNDSILLGGKKLVIMENCASNGAEIECNGSNVSPADILNPSTQESQDISLHFSETQCFEVQQNMPENHQIPVSEELVSDLKENGGKGTLNSTHGIENQEVNQVDANNLNETFSKDAALKRSSSWEKLNAAMKFSDEDSEPEESPIVESFQTNDLSCGPRLSLKGAPDDVIDLDDVNPKTSRTTGVQSLIERFMKHSASKKKAHKAKTVELSLISSEKDIVGGVVDVKHETLKVVLTGGDDDDARTDHQTPGAKLKLLKDELNRQMRKQKEEEWQKKKEEMENEQTFKGEKDDCGMLPDEDEEEEEEEMTDSEAESEPEINDVREPKRKKKSKSVFVDEEAEVENDDDENIEPDEREESESDDGDDKDSDNDDDNDSNSNDLDDMAVCDGDEDNQIRKASETVAASADSDHQGTGSQDGVREKNENCRMLTSDLRQSLTSVDLFGSQSSELGHPYDDDDDFIPAGQRTVRSVSQNGNTRERDDSEGNSMLFSPLSFSIPVKRPSFMDSANERTPTKMSYTYDAKTPSSIKKLLGEPDISSTQDKFDELRELFASKFNDPQDEIAKLANTTSCAESETDLMALCSGKFVTQLPNSNEIGGDCTQASQPSPDLLTPIPSIEPSLASTVPVEDSQDFSLKWNEDSRNCHNEVARPQESTKTKNFELEIMSSDEEDITVTVESRKKKHKKLDFSDDEDDQVDVNSEASDVSKDDDSCSPIMKNGKEKLFGVFQKPAKEVFYDSDENEIEATDFLEKEAELSDEEDWQGSDDEDEKGLDQLEMDEADKEDIDQDAVREQLVKNHMQKMLDEDRRDVRILQEMLLEDGELHSDAGGRERQFRWRNVDSTGMADNGQQSDDERGDNDEEEDDAEWRKKRHEREMFLKEQREKQDKESGELAVDDEVLENSELLQLGKAVLFKSRSNSLDLTSAKESQSLKPSVTINNQLLSPEGKRKTSLFSKRGSFLSRGDNVLAKLAKLTGPAKENVLAGAKNSGNFVFTAVSPPKQENKINDETDSKALKRKASACIANPKDKKPCLLAPVRKGSGLFDHL